MERQMNCLKCGAENLGWRERCENCGAPLHEREAPAHTPWRRVRPLWRTVALTLATFSLYYFYWFWTTWCELKHETSDEGMKPFGHMLSLFVPIYQLFRIHAHFRVIRGLVIRRSEVKSVGLVPWSPGVALFLVLLGVSLMHLSADLSVSPSFTGSPWQQSILLVLGTLLGFHASRGGLLVGAFHMRVGLYVQTVGGLFIAIPPYISISPGLSLVVFLASMSVFVLLLSSAQQALNSVWLETSGAVRARTRWYHWVVLILGAGG